jgi:hypothetical protein
MVIGNPKERSHDKRRRFTNNEGCDRNQPLFAAKGKRKVRTLSMRAEHGSFIDSSLLSLPSRPAHA